MADMKQEEPREQLDSYAEHYERVDRNMRKVGAFILVLVFGIMLGSFSICLGLL